MCVLAAQLGVVIMRNDIIKISSWHSSPYGNLAFCSPSALQGLYYLNDEENR